MNHLNATITTLAPVLAMPALSQNPMLLPPLLAETGGCTLIPGLEAVEHPTDSLIRQFAEPQPAREVSLVVRPNYHREALLHGITTTIQGIVPQSYRAFPSYRRLPWTGI